MLLKLIILMVNQPYTDTVAVSDKGMSTGLSNCKLNGLCLTLGATEEFCQKVFGGITIKITNTLSHYITTDTTPLILSRESVKVRKALHA